MTFETTPHLPKMKFEVIDENSILIPPNCYACCQCHKCVHVNKVFRQSGYSYCAECFKETFNVKCCYCQKFIQGSNEMKFVYYNNRVWHAECFSKSRTTL